MIAFCCLAASGFSEKGARYSSVDLSVITRCEFKQ